jgi:hypothetical protein
MAFALRSLKTPPFKSSASLSCVTRCDHLDELSLAAFRVVVLDTDLTFLRGVVLRGDRLGDFADVRCCAMITAPGPKRGSGPFGSLSLEQKGCQDGYPAARDPVAAFSTLLRELVAGLPPWHLA